ncbi:MAG: hypothetical protein V1928_02155 [Parcubacteria group bacterium]
MLDYEKVEAVSEFLKIPIDEAKKIIKPDYLEKISRINNVAEADRLKSDIEMKDEFRDFFGKKEMVKLILHKWRSLVCRMVEDAADFYQAETACRAADRYYQEAFDPNVPDPTDTDIQNLAFEKMFSFCMDKEKAESACRFCIPVRHGGNKYYLAVERWLSFCETAAESEDVFDYVSINDEIRFIALKKWLSFCETFNQVKRAHASVLSKIRDLETWEHNQYHYFTQELRQIIIIKWVSLCSTIAEAKEVYNVAPHFSEAQRQSMEKWLSLCTTVEDAKAAFNAASTHNSGEEIRFLAIRQLYDLI